MNAAQFDCSIELLRDALHMPERSRIVGAEMTDSGRSVRLTVDDPDLPDSPDPHLTVPVVTIERFRWDWALPL